MLQSTKSYPLRLEPEHGESLFGFLHRFVERNGLSRTTWLTDDLKMSFGATHMKPHQIAQFSQMCGVPEILLSQRQTLGGRARGQILGTSIQRTYVRGRVSRVCLDCLDDAPYHRLIWDLLPISECPIHRVAIVEACPTCATPLKWHRPRLLKCVRNHDLRARPHAPHDRQKEKFDVSGIRAVYEVCGFDHGCDTVLANLPAPIRTLPAGAFVELLIWLGELGRLAESGVTSSRKLADNHPFSLSRGFAVVQDWPAQLHLALEPAITGQYSFLGPKLTAWITKTMRGLSLEAKAVIRPSLFALAQSRGRARVFGLAHPSDTGRLSIAQARKLLGTSLQRLHELADENDWRSHRTDAGWLDRAKIEHWIRDRRTRVSMKTLRERLGTQPKNITAMIALGVFGSAAVARLPTMRRKPYLQEAELSHFMSAIESSINRCNELRDAITWIQYSRRTDMAPVDLATTLKAVLDGRLRPIGKRTQQIGRLIFRLEDLRALAQRTPTDREDCAKSEQTLRMADASAALSVDTKVLNLAWRVGLLPRRIGRAGERRVALSDATALLAEYAPTEVIAKECGKSSKSVARLLWWSGVRPAVGGRGQGVALYRVSDVGTPSALLTIARAKSASRPHTQGRAKTSLKAHAQIPADAPET